jgi:hypothetical protein
LVVAAKEEAAKEEAAKAAAAEVVVTMSLSRPEIVDDLKAGSRAGTVSTH